jgi:hypothetical protein
LAGVDVAVALHKFSAPLAKLVLVVLEASQDGAVVLARHAAAHAAEVRAALLRPLRERLCESGWRHRNGDQRKRREHQGNWSAISSAV